MKKAIILIILLLNISNLFSIMQPLKNKEVGALVGKIKITFLNDWWGFKSGESFYRFKVFIKNKFNGMIYCIFSDKNGLFYSLNLPAGHYIVTGCDFVFMSPYASYIEQITFNKELTIGIHKNTISVIKSIYLTIDKDYLVGMERYDETEIVKSLFYKKDKQGYWKDYEWGDFEIDEKNKIGD